MTPHGVRQWMARLGVIGGTAAILAGCPDNPDKLAEPGSQPSWDSPVSGAYAAPTGPFTIDRFALGAVDETVSDAFDRAGTTFVDSASFFTCGGACPAWDFPIRNGSEDTRLPALQDNDATGSFAITPDSLFGDALVVFTLEGLAANGSFTIALERLALTVNENLDHVNNLLNNAAFGAFQRTPDAPDALAPLGGSPGTTLGSNPYSIGGFTTNATGASGFLNFGFDGGGTNDIVETNALSSFDLPQYNYVVVYDDATGEPVMRAQVGVDLDASGQPINNALAPFPTEALTVPEILATPAGFGRPDSVSVTFNQLEELVGGAEYQAWLVNPGTGAFVPALGTYDKLKIVAERDPITGEVVATRDSVVETTTGISSFIGGDQADDIGIGFRHRLTVSDATLPGGATDSVGFYTYLLLTIAESPNLANLPDSRPWWVWYTDQKGTPEDVRDDEFFPDTLTSFGNFDLTNPAASRLYSGQGQGQAGFREDEFIAELTRLSRPPVGFELVGWLMSEDGTTYQLPDISGPPPDRVDLSNADVEDVSGIITDNGILEAYFRGFQENLAGATWYDANPPTPTCEADEMVNPDRAATGLVGSDLTTFWITLEAKNGAPGMGSIPVQAAEVPQRIVRGEPECIPKG
jgi:hypothetical protein